ncbi:MgtC/SapB family protein [Rhodohalobacter halophilus]|uniref:MgtC/SapB family protein n=1 Tax=Rhodohalobacter halophilus TaxID=1812810 RepID=UPI00083F66B6|nr:MgtC/SapB family protein [Rhodohalobacter halophilus]
MQELHDISLSLLVALSIGLLIGIERGWSERDEKEGDRMAGIRTFSVVGLLGGVWGLLALEIDEWVMAAAFLAVTAMIISAHIMDVKRDEDVGATTAFTLMLVFVLSAWSVFGYELPALGATVIVTALLGYKPTLHRWLRNINRKEIYAWTKLLVISLVLLPLLPNEGYGPWEAFNPYWVWWMVVLISGLSFVGYVAIKIAGKNLGTMLTSFVGGLASSTAVTISLAQFSKKSKTTFIFMAGVLLASSIMFIRVLIEVSVVNYQLLDQLWLPISLMFTGLIIAGFWLWQFKVHTEESSPIKLKNPFQLKTAIQFGLLLGAILILSEGMQEWFGDQGVYVLSVISGLMDVDAITLSLSRMSQDNLREEVAVMGIILAAVTNTLVKGLIFSFFVGIKRSLTLLILLILAITPGILAAGFMVWF